MRQLDMYSSLMQETYKNLENEVINILIDRLNVKGLDEANFNVYQYQLERMAELHLINEKVVTAVAKATKINRNLLRKMIIDGGYEIADETNKTFSNAGVERVDDTTTTLDTILQGMLTQTFRDLDNHVNQTLVTTNFGDSPVTKAYEGILDKMVASQVTGIKTAKQAFYGGVYELIGKGLESGFIDKGGHHWSVEAYTRTVLDSTKYRVMNETRMQVSKDYGIHTFIMSSHPASRPACAHIQGKIVNDVRRGDPGFDENYPTIYDFGYGEPAGTFGINCKHMKLPHVPGIESHQVQYKPDEAIKNGAIEQRQRQLERNIRKYKGMKQAAEKLGDEQGLTKYKGLISNNQLALRQLINKYDFLRRDYSREKVFITPNKASLDKYRLPDRKNAVIPNEKFTKYILDPYHERGSNKAKVFESVLGFNQKNANNLISQIRAGLNKAEAIPQIDQGYGQRYKVEMPIIGVNGKTKQVVTAWIKDKNTGNIRLVTAYIK